MSGVFEPDRLVESCGDEPAMIAGILAEFLASIPPMLDDVRSAVTAGDALRLQHAAHALKGSCRTVGTDAAAAVCEELETLGRSGGLAAAGRLVTELEHELEQAQAAIEAHLARAVP